MNNTITVVDPCTDTTSPVRFIAGLSNEYGHKESPADGINANSCANNFVPTQIDILELIKHQSADQSPSGGAITTAKLRKSGQDKNGNPKTYWRNKKFAETTQLIGIDIDAKIDAGWTTEKIKEYFGTIEDLRSRVPVISPMLAAVLPSKSLPTEINDTIVAHLFFPLEHPISLDDASKVIAAIVQEIITVFPHLTEDATKKKTGLKGGLDAGATKNTVGLWYGMRADQSAMFVNTQACVPTWWINHAIENHTTTPRREYGSTIRLRSRGSNRRNPSLAEDNPNTIELSDQIIDEVIWFFENVLPPPGVGTYNEWFLDIKHFCCSWRPFFDDAFIDLVHSDNSGHRAATSTPEQQLNSGGFDYPPWGGLVRALNTVEPDWLAKFYEAHGYHTMVDFSAPRKDAHLIPFQRYHLMLLTKTHHLECTVPTRGDF